MKINLSDTDKLQTALDKAQGNRKKRLLTVEQIQNKAKEVEEKLDKLLPKKYQVGAEYFYMCPDVLPNSYKWSALSTFVRLERFSTGWFVTNIGVYYTPKGSGKTEWLHLTESQKTAIGELICYRFAEM
jgi:hypothetical protein